MREHEYLDERVSPRADAITEEESRPLAWGEGSGIPIENATVSLTFVTSPQGRAELSPYPTDYLSNICISPQPKCNPESDLKHMHTSWARYRMKILPCLIDQIQAFGWPPLPLLS